MPTRPTWAEISLTALRNNFATIRDYVAPQATVLCVVKADAYGHGTARCSHALQQEGAKWFGVTSTEEGVELRRAGITGRILLMSGFFRGEEEAVLEHALTPAIWSWDQVELLENAAEKMKQPAVAVHLKVDTGMTRLGVSSDELAGMVEALTSTQAVSLEGVFSHLASAEVVDAPDVDKQLDRFDAALEQIKAAGLAPAYEHIANSAALVTRERSWKNMVRPGISLYGYYLPFVSVVTHQPDASVELPIKPVLAWKTRIMALRNVEAQTPIGYNGGYRTSAPARIAVLPVGYGDGVSRYLSNHGRVIVRGDYASIVGNVSMDLTTVDVTGIPGVSLGDEVVLIGESGSRRISAWEHASHAGTIPYEVLCNISKRVPRVYVE